MSQELPKSVSSWDMLWQGLQAKKSMSQVKLNPQFEAGTHRFHWDAINPSKQLFLLFWSSVESQFLTLRKMNCINICLPKLSKSSFCDLLILANFKYQNHCKTAWCLALSALFWEILSLSAVPAMQKNQILAGIYFPTTYPCSLHFYKLIEEVDEVVGGIFCQAW